MSTTNRFRRIGWGVCIACAFIAVAILSLNVHAVRSDVLKADARLADLEAKKQRLETEFQVRAGQHQLARWNRFDLGYVAPRADQYIDTSVQLAQLGQPAGPDAPSPIRVARASRGDGGAGFGPDGEARPMVSPISGRPVTLAAASVSQASENIFVEAFGDMLIEASPIRQARAQTGEEQGFLVAAQVAE